MYGLFNEVLHRQRNAGGSALLLSATLPYIQRKSLIDAWEGRLNNENDAYPLVTHVNQGEETKLFQLTANDMPKEKSVKINVLEKTELLPDDALVQQMLSAAEQGAQVVFICNLVDVAQSLSKRLKEITTIRVDLFHARFRFMDRNKIEKDILEKYGKHGDRSQGAILIATQVVEQSLDLDFDWMITQLCPIDLLFQRLGRLHRHSRSRPNGFEYPECTVLIPDDGDYGHHGLIYGNTRVLWRTAQLLIDSGGSIRFPHAYREWIEKVYQESSWGNEPDTVLESYELFCDDNLNSRSKARQLINTNMTELMDTDSNVSALTRDGEMSLNVLPLATSPDGDKLIGQKKTLENLEDWWRDEAINLNIVSVPKSWEKFLSAQENGLYVLQGEQQNNYVLFECKGAHLKYSTEYGLEKELMK